MSLAICNNCASLIDTDQDDFFEVEDYNIICEECEIKNAEITPDYYTNDYVFLSSKERRRMNESFETILKKGEDDKSMSRNNRLKIKSEIRNIVNNILPYDSELSIKLTSLLEAMDITDRSK